MASDNFKKESGLVSLFVLTLTLFLTLVGCGKQSVAPAPLPTREKAAKEMDRYEWLLANSAGDYLKIGVRNKKWDALVLQAFTNQSRARAGLKNEGWGEVILKAHQAGCTDPLVGYWRARAEYGDATDANMASLPVWTNAANAMAQSGYSPYRKFYASLRAFEAMRATRKAEPTPTERTNWMIAASIYIDAAIGNAAKVAGDSEAPAEEVLVLVEDFLNAAPSPSQANRQFVIVLERALRKGHPNAPQTEHILGKLEIDRAWLARGGDVASKTTDEQFRGFEEHLDKAEKLLLKAWKTQPRVETAMGMMTIQLGRSDSRNEMEHWFKEAMALQTNSYAAARVKYYYLEPKWHGSREAQHEFGLECVASTNWGGYLPRILLDFYGDVEPSDPAEKKSFYARREVWTEIQSALDKLLKLNPDDSGWHYNYFKFAYLAGDWPVAGRELKAMGEVTDYSYFGGEKEFKEMAAKVKTETAVTPK